MSVKLRVLLFVLVSAAVASSAVLLYLYKFPVSLNSIDTYCGYKGPEFKRVQANLTRDHKLWLNATRGAFQDEYPFSVLLSLTINETYPVDNESHWRRSRVQCNGVILTDTWLLTSAQCVNHRLLLNESFAASAFITSHNLTEQAKLTTLQAVKHFNFSINQTTGLVSNDIALVRVAPIKFIEMYDRGHYLCPVCADQVDKIDQVFTPWFQLNQTEKDNVTLFTSEMSLLQPEDCAAVSLSFSVDTVCTSQATLKIDASKKVADKGSPLLVQGESKMNLIAISSYYVERKDAEPLLVYTNVSNYREWIKSVADQNQVQVTDVQ